MSGAVDGGTPPPSSGVPASVIDPSVHPFGLSVGQGPGRAKDLVAQFGTDAKENVHVRGR